jgi:hypothetical protein
MLLVLLLVIVQSVSRDFACIYWAGRIEDASAVVCVSMLACLPACIM